jgi:hypothetical protein
MIERTSEILRGVWRLIAATLWLLIVCTGQGDERDDLQRVQMRATTSAYREAMLDLLLAEVNQIARDLDLPEKLPIRRSDLLEVRVNTPYWADWSQASGGITTSNYHYFASVGNRLTWVDPNFGPDAIQEQKYMESLWRRYAMPVSQMNTNAAYAMATQWLAEAGMDLQGIERDADRVEVMAFERGTRFVPVYVVAWQRLATHRAMSVDMPPTFESIASVRLVSPERRLLQMRVNQLKYVRRKPLLLPNRDKLLLETTNSELRKLWSTTEAYKQAALEVMHKEAQWAASALNLPDSVPASSSGFADAIICAPYVADHQGGLGAVYTDKYCYGAGKKFSSVERSFRISGGEENFNAAIWSRYRRPKTGEYPLAVYSLATQWLAGISVDVKKLESSYPPQVSNDWISDGYFVPIYKVEWAKPIEGSSREDVAAMVEVLEPERLLLKLIVNKPEFMTRAPIVIPNREQLLRTSNSK